MTATELKTIRERTQAYHMRILKDGGQLTTYTCPFCDEKIPTVQPRPEQVPECGYWDSAKTCIQCGEISFVMVRPEGKTKVQMI